MKMGLEEGGGQPPNLEALVAKILKDEEGRKKKQEQIDNIQSNLRIIGNMICNSKTGECKLVTREDLVTLAETQGTKGDLSGYKNKELYAQLIKSETAVEDLQKAYGLEKLKEDPESMLRAAQDPEFRKKFIATVCSNDECRVGLNQTIEEFHKTHKGKGQGKSFLINKK